MSMSIEEIFVLATPWLVVLPDGKLSIMCERCGSAQAPDLPMSVLEYERFLTDFQNTHSQCTGGDRSVLSALP